MADALDLRHRFPLLWEHDDAAARPGTTGIHAWVDDAGGQAIEARLDRLVDLLVAQGDTDPDDVLSAKALVLLAAPEGRAGARGRARPAGSGPDRSCCTCT